MSLSTSSLRRLGAILTLVAVAAAIAAPTTLANHRDVGTKTALQELRAITAAPDAVERYVRSHPQTVPNARCDAVCRYLADHGQASGTLVVTENSASQSRVDLLNANKASSGQPVRL